MMADVVDPCILCRKIVRPRQEAIQCEKCSFWQHRICNTGIDRNSYRQAVKGLLELQWTCDKEPTEMDISFIPDHESTNIDINVAPICNTTYTVMPSADAIDQDSHLRPDEVPEVYSHTDDISLPSFEVPEPMQEESLTDPDPAEVSNLSASDTLLYEVITDGSQRAKDKLLHRDGFAFVVTRRQTNVTYWRCSVRSKVLKCPATVSQRGDDFIPGQYAHNHTASVGIGAKVRASKKR